MWISLPPSPLFSSPSSSLALPLPTFSLPFPPFLSPSVSLPLFLSPSPLSRYNEWLVDYVVVESCLCQWMCINTYQVTCCWRLGKIPCVWSRLFSNLVLLNVVLALQINVHVFLQVESPPFYCTFRLVNQQHTVLYCSTVGSVNVHSKRKISDASKWKSLWQLQHDHTQMFDLQCLQLWFNGHTDWLQVALLCMWEIYSAVTCTCTLGGTGIVVFRWAQIQNCKQDVMKIGYCINAGTILRSWVPWCVLVWSVPIQL